jgi:hypothetical protein
VDTHASAAQHEILLKNKLREQYDALCLRTRALSPRCSTKRLEHTKKHCIITQRRSTTEGGGRLRRLKSTHVLSLFHVPGYLYPPVKKKEKTSSFCR